MKNIQVLGIKQFVIVFILYYLSAFLFVLSLALILKMKLKYLSIHCEIKAYTFQNFIAYNISSILINASSSLFISKLVHTFARLSSLILFFIHLFSYSFIRSLDSLVILSLSSPHSFVSPLIHLPTHSSPHSFISPLIRPLISASKKLNYHS